MDPLYGALRFEKPSFLSRASDYVIAPRPLSQGTFKPLPELDPFECRIHWPHTIMLQRLKSLSIPRLLRP